MPIPGGGQRDLGEGAEEDGQHDNGIEGELRGQAGGPWDENPAEKKGERILNGKYRVDPANWFILQRDQVREGATSTTPPGAKGLPEALLSRPTANLEVRRELFSNKVVDKHNRLPDTVTLTPGSLSLREILPQEDGGALCQP